MKRPFLPTEKQLTMTITFLRDTDTLLITFNANKVKR
jgi:hypothetical protein